MRILGFIIFFSGSIITAQVNFISLEETCDFISKSHNGLLYFGTTEDYFVYNGHAVVRRNINLDGSHNVQSKLFHQNDTFIWFATYDGLVRHNVVADIYDKFQINEQSTIYNSDYYVFELDLSKSLLWLKCADNIYHFNINNFAFTKIAENVSGRRILSYYNSQNNKILLSYYYTYNPTIIKFNFLNRAEVLFWKNWPSSTLARDLFKISEDEVFIIAGKKYYIGNINSLKLTELKMPEFSKYTAICGYLIEKETIVLSFGQDGIYKITNFNQPERILVKRLFHHDIKYPIDRITCVDSNVVAFSSYNNGIYFYDRSKIKFEQFEWTPKVDWGMRLEDRIFLHLNNGQDTSFLLSQFNLLKQEITESENKVFGNINNKLSGVLKNSNKLFYKKYSTFNHKEKLKDNSIFRVMNFSKDFVIFSQINSVLKIDPNGIEEKLVDKQTDKTINYYYQLDSNLHIYQFNEEQIKVYDDERNKCVSEVKFSGDIFNQVLLDSILYLSTTQGIYTLRLKTLEFKPLSSNYYSNSKVCNCVTIDNQGWLWASGTDYIIKYKKDSSVVFSFSDGFNRSRFLRNGCGRLSNNFLFFIQENGLVIIDPLNDKSLKKKCNLFIEDLTINKERILISELSKEFPKIKVNYSDLVSFNLFSNDLASPFQTTIKYKLSSIDKEWTYSSSNKVSFNYQQLLPGNYELKILGINSDNIENQLIQSLALVVLPPYYMTWWFRSIMIASILGIVYFGIRFYYKRQLEKKDSILREQQLIIEKQQAIEKERSRIASEMHDDLGSGLTTIRYLSDKAARTAGSEDERMQIHRIADQSNQLVRNMSEIIWAMNSRFDTLDNLVSYMRRHASEYLEEHNIKLKWEQSVDSGNSKVSGEKRRNIFLVMKECLHNVVKHSNAREVSILINSLADQVKIIIQDNGIGFDIDKTKEHGNGLFNMKKRMEAIEGAFSIDSGSSGTKLNINFKFDQESNQEMKTND